MAAPNSTNTEHPVGGGQSPAYLGGPGGQVGFFQDPYGAVFQATASGTTLTVLSLTQGTIVVGQTITSINGVASSGVSIIAMGSATAQYGAGAVGTWTLSSSVTQSTAATFTSGLGAQVIPSSLNASPSLNYNQPQSAQQANSTSGTMIVKYQSLLNTTATAATTTIAQTTSVTSTLQLTSSPWQPSSSSSVFTINKASHNAGFGIGGVRCQTSGIFTVEGVNLTVASISPSSDIYDIIEVKASQLTATATVTPVAAPPQSTQEVIVSVGTNVALPGYAVIVNKPTAQTTAGSTVVVPTMAARIIGAGQVGITIGNPGTTAAGFTAASEAYQFAFLPQITATTPFMVYGVPAGQNSVTASSIIEATSAITGLKGSDVAVGWTSGATTQVSTAVIGMRVTSAGVMGVKYMAPNGAQTPTSNEVYAVTILRQTPLNPVQMYYPTLNATTCAASTTVEATTTVTGLLVSSSVIVNKPTYTPGIAILNARVSAADTLAVTYGNFTTSSISVPAETYTVANVQIQGPGTGAAVTSGLFAGVSFNPTQQEAIRNAYALRSALLSLNLISGV